MITLASFYYVYLIVVFIFLVFTFFNVYHLLRFGFLSFGNIAITALYIFISIGILIVSWEYIRAVDWSLPLEILPSFTPPPGL
jgi:hypothetical protein